MAALSMATIAAFVDGPGLGQPVLAGLRIKRRRRGVRARLADRGHGHHARPHHDRGQRARRDRGARAAAATPTDRRRIVLGRRRASCPSWRSSSRATYTWAWRSSPSTRSRSRGRRRAAQRRSSTGSPTPSGQRRPSRRLKDAVTNGAPQPDAVAARRLAVVARRRCDLLRHRVRRRAAGGLVRHASSAWPASATSTCGTTR